MGSAASITAESIANNIRNLNDAQRNSIDEILSKGPSKNRLAVLSLLQDLSVYDCNKIDIISTKYKFKPVLLSVLHGTAEEKLRSLSIFAGVSTAPENKSVILKPEFGLANELFETLKGRNVAECSLVFEILLNCVTERENVEILLSDPYDIVTVVLKEFSSGTGEDYALALSLILSLAKAEKEIVFRDERCELLMSYIQTAIESKVKPDCRLKALQLYSILTTVKSLVMPVVLSGLPLLVLVLPSGSNEEKIIILKMMCHMAMKERGVTECPIKTNQKSLLLALKTIMDGVDMDIYYYSMQLMLQLSEWSEHVSYMCDKDIDLVCFLMNEIKGSEKKQIGEDNVITILMVIGNISSKDENRLSVGAPQNETIAVMKDIIKKTKSLRRQLALSVLLNLSFVNFNMEHMAAAETDLFLGLMEIVYQYEEEELVSVAYALEIIKNLLSSVNNKKYVSSLQLGIMKLMMEVISKNHKEPTHIALHIIFNITLDSDSVVFVAAALRLGLHDKLIIVISRSDANSVQRTIAWGCLGVISKTPEHTEYLIEQQPFLQFLISSLATDESGGVVLVILSIISNLIKNPAHVPPLVLSRELRFVNALLGVIRKNGEGFCECHDIIFEISKCSAVLEQLVLPELNFLHSLTVEIADEGNPSITPSVRLVILDTIFNLSVPHSNIERMLTTEGSLYTTLLAVVKADRSCLEVVSALKTIQNFAVLTKNAIFMSSEQFGLLKLLLFIVSNKTDERRSAAVKVLRQLSVVPETIESLGSEEAAQIPFFCDILNKMDSLEIMAHVLDLLKSLSSHSTSNKIYMASSSHGLIQILLDIISRENDSRIIENILKILRNVSSAAKNQPILASKESEMINGLLKLIGTANEDHLVIIMAIFRNLTSDHSVAISLTSDDRNIVQILNSVALKDLQSDATINALTSLRNLSNISENIDVLADSGIGVVSMALAAIKCPRVETKNLAFNILRNLSCSERHAQRLIASPDDNLVRSLLSIINQGRDSDTVHSLTVLQVISGIDSVRAYLASNEINLVNILVKLIPEKNADTRCLALACLDNLSKLQENISILVNDDLKLLALICQTLDACLEKIVEAYDSRLRDEIGHALSIVLNLCSSDTVKMTLVSSSDIGFLRILISFLKLPTMDENKSLALLIMISLTSIMKIKTSFGAPESGLTNLLKDTLIMSLSMSPSDAVSDVTNKALGVILNLSTAKKNMSYLGSSDLGLVPVLLVAMKKPLLKSTDLKRTHALSILQNISCSEETLLYLNSSDLGLYKYLLDFICGVDAKGEERALALGIIRNISTELSNVVPMSNESFGLFDILVNVLCNGNEKEKIHTLIIFQNVSCEEKNAISLGRPETRLVPILLNEIKISDPSRDELLNAYIDVLRNLSSVSANIEYFISRDLHSLDILVEVIRKSGENAEASVNAMGALCNFADEHVAVEALLEKNVYSIAIASLSNEKEKKALEWGNEETFAINSLILILKMSQWSESFKIFEEEGVLPLLQCYLDVDKPSAHTMRAFLSILFLIRDKEQSFHWDMLNSGPLKCQNIIRALEAMLNHTPEPECENIAVKLMIRASTCLCLNESNMIEFAKPNMVSLFVTILQAFEDKRSGKMSFASNSDDLKLDLDCAELAVQGLVIISLKHGDDDDLKAELFSEEIQTTLCPLLKKLEEVFSKLEYRQFALYLLFRLKGREGIGYAKPFSTHRHIFLSCAIDKGMKHDLILSLTTSLKDVGYEVWTESSGSLLAPEVSEKSLENRIARIMAAKTSAAIIVCVSRLYKKSLMGRLDVLLASETVGCKMIFVLMESDYGIDSSPDHVDGWLLHNIKKSNAPVFRLWLSSHLKTATSEIFDHIGSNVAQHEVLADGIGSSGSGGGITLLEASIIGLSSEQIAKYNTAWELIQTSTNSVDYGVLSRYLETIGVYDALDLRQCDDEDIEVITNLLKKIQRKVFTTCLSKK